MEISGIKLELIEWITRLKDERVLKSLAELKSWESNLPAHKLTVEELKARILQSEEDIKSRNYTTHEDLLEEIKGW